MAFVTAKVEYGAVVMVEAVPEHWLPSKWRDPNRWKALLQRVVSLLRFRLFLAVLALLGVSQLRHARAICLAPELMSNGSSRLSACHQRARGSAAQGN
jgi:hypothetical protein